MTFSSHDTFWPGVTPRLLLGLGLALFGVVLLLGQLNLIDAHAVLRFWPLLLVAIGLRQFFNPRREGAAGSRIPVNGTIWIVLGGILLLNSFRILHVSIWDLFWPAVLIALGVRLMTRPGLWARDAAGSGTGDTAAQGGDIGSVFAVLGGVKRVSAPLPFRGAEVTTFMGGAQIDLRQALLAPGAEAVLDVFAVMGGCELQVPPHWVVSAPVVAVMGGVDDKRVMSSPNVIDQATAPGAAAPRLVIRGFVMMGGVTIRG